MSSISPPRVVGSWQECSRTGCGLIFFRYGQGNKCYSLSDKTGICPLCIFQKKVENGTLTKRAGDISQFVHHKSVDARPGADTL